MRLRGIRPRRKLRCPPQAPRPSPSSRLERVPLSRSGVVVTRFVVDYHGAFHMGKSNLEFARHLRRRMTPAEKVLWSRVRNRRLGGYKIRRQAIVSGYFPDFYCPECKLIIEVDGEIHRYKDVALGAGELSTQCNISAWTPSAAPLAHYT